MYQPVVVMVSPPTPPHPHPPLSGGCTSKAPHSQNDFSVRCSWSLSPVTRYLGTWSLLGLISIYVLGPIPVWLAGVQIKGHLGVW